MGRRRKNEKVDQRVTSSVVALLPPPWEPMEGRGKPYNVAPALASATFDDEGECPFKIIRCVHAYPVTADAASSKYCSGEIVHAEPFTGFVPGVLWQGKIPVVLGPPPGLPVGVKSSLTA